MIKSKWAIRQLFKSEAFIFRHCDLISSISKAMAHKIQEKAKKNIVLFPNWTDTQSFFPIDDKARLREEYGFNADDKIILYSGAIGEKQGLHRVIEVANQLRSLSHMKFVICGSGPYKEQLQATSKKLGLKNVSFFPIQPNEKFNNFLNLADVHLVIQKSSASDLVMPSKLTTILAVGGLSLITADPGSGLHSFVKENNLGILVGADNSESIKDALLYIINTDLSHINRNARQYAESFLSVDKVMDAYAKHFDNTPQGLKKVPAFAPGTLSTVSVTKQNITGTRVGAASETRR